MADQNSSTTVEVDVHSTGTISPYQGSTITTAMPSSRSPAPVSTKTVHSTVDTSKTTQNSLGNDSKQTEVNKMAIVIGSVAGAVVVVMSVTGIWAYLRAKSRAVADSATVLDDTNTDPTFVTNSQSQNGFTHLKMKNIVFVNTVEYDSLDMQPSEEPNNVRFSARSFEEV